MIYRKIFKLASVLVLLGALALLAYQCVNLWREAAGCRQAQTAATMNKNVVGFMQIFIKQVLKNDKGVDFETRLKLETAVRDLKDEQILASWQKFTDSKTEAEAQSNVKDLLEILADKIKQN